MSEARRAPSIRRRLARALLAASLWWSVAVSAAVWLAVEHEVDELLDEVLQSAAAVLAPQFAAGAASGEAAAAPPASAGHFAWQVVDHGAADGARLVARSALAPERPITASPAPGYVDLPDWRSYGVALGEGGRMLYVAQTRSERREALAEVAWSAALATLAVALLAHLWLGARVRHELQPLQDLAARLRTHDALAADATLGPAAREELMPVHEAIDALAASLARRIGQERAFSAHAAHALRTPLAAIDAQLAIALRESAPEGRERLQKVRAAAGRLQRVVAALLALFRSGVRLERRTIDLRELAARLPVEGLTLRIDGAATLVADADLVSAALLNLIDNALRHGARNAVLDAPGPQRLRLADDGPGVPAGRRAALQAAIDAQAYEGTTGLGLMLADLVARAHGGTLRLDTAPAGGLAVELDLGAPMAH